MKGKLKRKACRLFLNLKSFRGRICPTIYRGVNLEAEKKVSQVERYDICCDWGTKTNTSNH